jgi:cytochrome c-type biogenesis protein CcmH
MSVLWFWIPAVVLSVIVVGLVALGVVRGARLREAGEGRERRELGIYADQLREIERDKSRGLVSEDEAERLRAETARRLLDADRKAGGAASLSPTSMRGVALALVVLVPLGAAAVYWSAGAYGYGDMPLDARIAEAAEIREARAPQEQLEQEWRNSPGYMPPPEPEPRYAELMQQLRAALENRPDDLTGLRLLATNEENLGNHAAAARTYVRIIELQGENAPLVDLEALAENMIMATGGAVSPQAEVVLERILRRDGRNGMARYYLGLMFAQTGRPDLTFRLWRGLLEDSAPNDAWVPAIRGTIEDLADIAGVRYTLPPVAAMGSRGPSAEDMAAAAEMTEEERQEMIGGMVEGLASRLANSGGTPEDWARLIGALGVLGQTDRARGIWAEARMVFADRPEALAVIEEVARGQGFIE